MIKLEVNAEGSPGNKLSKINPSASSFVFYKNNNAPGLYLYV